MSKFIDLTGQKFGKLTVIKRVEDHVCPSGQHIVQWLCECDCDDKSLVVVQGNHLKTKHTESCGCLQKEMTSLFSKKYNTYDLSGEYGIGYTYKGEEFYFDLEDYDLIKDYCWCIDKRGYVFTSVYNNKQSFHLHKLIIQTNKTVDHINHKKFDNRKCNLRVATYSQNCMNKEILARNTSSVTGVGWVESKQQWRARITVGYKEIHLGYFDKFEDAVKVRKDAEERYFGEFSYDNSMSLNN